jgi:hypothetical protein
VNPALLTFAQISHIELPFSPRAFACGRDDVLKRKTSMRQFASNDEDFATLCALIERWCDERKFHALSRVLTGWRNPNVMPWVANAAKEAADADMAGRAIPATESTCWPAGVPNIMNFLNRHYELEE